MQPDKQARRVATAVRKRPLIPVIIIDCADDAPLVAQALLAGGIDIIEITLRTPAALDAITKITTAFPEMLVGAGTVQSRQQADQVLDSGASFALAPGLNQEVVAHFQSKDRLFIPGVFTPSEVDQAMALGCLFLKYFPAGVGGIKMLKSLQSIYLTQGVQFCPTGGVNAENMNEFLSLDIVCSIGGSWIATPEYINTKNWTGITQNAKKALSTIQKATQ